MRKITRKQFILSLRVVLVVAMLISLFLINEHVSMDLGGFCNFGDTMNCDKVNKGPYATLDGFSYLMAEDFGWPIPRTYIAQQHWTLNIISSNAFLGLITLLGLFLLTFKLDEGWFFIKQKKTISWLRGILIFSVSYGFYLFLLQHFIIKSYCIFCIALDLLLITSLVLSYQIKKVKK